MNINDQALLTELEALKSQFLRGVWTSPDTTPKKTNWFIQCHNGQVAGQPEAGRIVYVTKSRGAFQLVQLTEQVSTGTDKQGLPVSLWKATVLA